MVAVPGVITSAVAGCRTHVSAEDGEDLPVAETKYQRDRQALERTRERRHVLGNIRVIQFLLLPRSSNFIIQFYFYIFLVGA